MARNTRSDAWTGGGSSGEVHAHLGVGLLAEAAHETPDGVCVGWRAHFCGSDKAAHASNERVVPRAGVVPFGGGESFVESMLRFGQRLGNDNAEVAQRVLAADTSNAGTESIPLARSINPWETRSCPGRASRSITGIATEPPPQPSRGGERGLDPDHTGETSRRRKGRSTNLCSVRFRARATTRRVSLGSITSSTSAMAAAR